MMPLKQNFINTFSNELTPVLLDFYDCPVKLGTIWVLLLEQESYFFIFFIYEKDDKKDIANYRDTQTPSPTLHLERWTRYFRHRHTIELSKNKMD